MPVATITSKGQITIPIQVQKSLASKLETRSTFLKMEIVNTASSPRPAPLQRWKESFSISGYHNWAALPALQRWIRPYLTLFQQTTCAPSVSRLMKLETRKPHDRSGHEHSGSLSDKGRPTAIDSSPGGDAFAYGSESGVGRAGSHAAVGLGLNQHLRRKPLRRCHSFETLPHEKRTSSGTVRRSSPFGSNLRRSKGRIQRLPDFRLGPGSGI